MNRLKDKVAIITGATSGIGRAAAKLFAAEGAQVVALGRSAERGEALEREGKESGGKIRFLPVDITDASQVEAAVRETVAAFGRLDTLYNNAGRGADKDATVTKLSEEAFDEVIKLNLWGTMLCCRAAIPEIIRSGGGAVINTASAAALMGVPDRDAYTAAKGGIVSLTRALAVQYGKDKLRVNTIMPATTATERVLKRFETASWLKENLSRQVLGIVQPEHIAQMAVFLASDECPTLTGQVLAIDGGLLVS